MTSRNETGRPLRALIVEDSEDDTKLLIRELKRGGYDVTYERVQTTEAMKAALEQASWDIVFSDHSMPQFSGPAALAVLKEAGHDLPFIIVSGTIGEETAVSEMKAGAHDFLVKGQLARLIPAVERELREASARKEHKRLEAQLRQAHKMEAIGRLAGGIAHDLNNILTTILGYSQMIMDQVGPDNPIGGDLLEIRKAGERAAALTRQLLAFSRKQTLRMQVVDVNQILGDTVDMLGRLIGEDIEIELSLASGLRPIMADRVQLEQVLMNLVANARDAMPRGGRLTIETGSASEEEVSAALGSAVSSGPCVSLTIHDTGAGMDADTRSRIFEPFFTTKELGKGTGLGLATVYGIVKQLGGFICVSSEVGRGTTFTIYFPESQSTAKPEAPRAVGTASPPLAAGKEVILLVEDETAVRNLVSLVLRRHGYTVLEARNGREGAALAAEQQGAIHAVLTDVVMPGIDGPETVKRLRESRPEMRVLYMTGYAGDALTRRGIVDARDRILHKPFTADELLKGVRELLDVD